MNYRVTFVTCGIAEWADRFLSVVSALSKRERKPVTTLAIRSDDVGHGPFFGNVPANTVFIFFDPVGAPDQNFPPVVITCHPRDREAVESRVQGMQKNTLLTIEPAPGRTEQNVTVRK